MVLCFVLALVKCTKIYFSGANNVPCLLAHSKHHSCIVCSVLQFSFNALSKTRVFKLSIKLVIEAGRVGQLQVSTRLELKKQKTIGNNSEP